MSAKDHLEIMGTEYNKDRRVLEFKFRVNLGGFSAIFQAYIGEGGGAKYFYIDGVSASKPEDLAVITPWIARMEWLIIEKAQEERTDL
jgi:hypothetical protein